VPRSSALPATSWRPPLELTALLSTIDGPYAASWAAAAWAGWRAIQRRSLSAWLLFGLTMGIGTLYKYTMLLALPGFIGFAAFGPRREDPQTPGSKVPTWLSILGALAVFLVVVSPIAIWNNQEHWPTIRHLLGFLNIKGGDKPVVQGGEKGWRYDPMWTLGFLGSVLVSAPTLVIALDQSRRLWRTRRDRAEGWRGSAYLLWLAAPQLVFYLLVSFLAKTQWNWTLTAQISVATLAGWGVVEGMDAWRALRTQEPMPASTPTRSGWIVTVILGLAVGFGILRLDLYASLPYVGKLVPLGRFTGADLMAQHMDRLCAEVEKETGQRPIILVQHYGRAAQFGFYMKGPSDRLLHLQPHPRRPPHPL